MLWSPKKPFADAPASIGYRNLQAIAVVVVGLSAAGLPLEDTE